MVCLLTLTSGPVLWAMMVSEPTSPLLGVGSGARAGNGYLYIFDADTDTSANHYIFQMKRVSLKY
jgi:hypothetical protein